MEERQTIIEMLVFLSGKQEGYFANMTQEELNAEYDRYTIGMKEG